MALAGSAIHELFLGKDTQLARSGATLIGAAVVAFLTPPKKR